MKHETPHFLRFARALALLSGVASVGCSATVAGQDVPPADTPPMVDAGIAIDTTPAPGVATAPDGSSGGGIREAPDASDVADASDASTSVTVDAGISAAPDANRPEVVGGPQAAPELPFA